MFSFKSISNRFSELKSLCNKDNPKTKFEIAFFNSVYNLPYDHWNKVDKSGNLLLSIPYLAAIEANPPRNMTFHYAIAYSDLRPVAILYFQEFDFMLASVSNNVNAARVDKFYETLSKVRGIFLKDQENIKMRLLVNGNSFVTGEYGFAHDSTISEQELSELITDATDRIVNSDATNSRISGILIKDFEPVRNALREKLISENYHVFTVDPNMVLKFDPAIKNMDDFLASFSSKYRVRAKSVRKKGSQIVRKELNAEDIEANSVRISELYSGVEGNANFQLLTITEQYFRDLKLALENNFHFLAYYYQDKLIGFAAGFSWEGAMEAHFVGIDYSLNAELALYQNMLLDYIELGLKHGAKQAFFGRTALELKSTVGCEPVDMLLFVKHTNSFSNRLIKPFFENLTQSEWVKRSPFREDVNGVIADFLSEEQSQ